MSDALLTGSLVRLRALRPDDLPVIVANYADPDVVPYMTWWTGPMGPDDARSFYETNLTKPAELRAMAIARLDDDVFLGAMGFVDIDWRARCGTLGIAIWNPEGRGHGRGTEAVGLFCAWAFGVLNLRRVQLSVFANNPRAIRAYEKAGFQLEGRRRQARFWDGEYHDVLEMGLLRDELLK